MNLVSNAAEAIGDEGGQICISTANRYLDGPLKAYDHIKEGEYIVLTVSDTGEGISPQDLKRIFEPFYTKKVMGRSGTGLGMSVVWGTVKDHRGYIDIETTEGKGTTFTLYFPATRKEPAHAEPIFAIEYYRGRGESVLADLLILDMVMDTGIDGLETYKRILELHPRQSAIIASGYSETDHVKEAQRLGAAKYVWKPYSIEKMGKAIRDALER